MNITNLEKANNLAAHYEECNKQIKMLQEGQIKICMKQGYHLHKIPDDALDVESPVCIILLNELHKVRSHLENELKKLGVVVNDREIKSW